MENKGEILSFNANKKWLSIPVETRKQLEGNVFCSKCLDTVHIEKNYVVKEKGNTIVLYGKCKTCGSDVARVID